MKKLYTAALLLMLTSLNAQIINFTDPNFKAKLLQATSSNEIALNMSLVSAKVDTNNDGEIQVSEAAAIKKLFVSNANISSWGGIEYFTNMFSLDVSSNNFTSIDVSHTVLPSLQWFYCNNNLLTDGSVDLTGQDLVILNMGSNAFTTFNFNQFPNLLFLGCEYNDLTSIDVSNCTSLKELRCQSNALTQIAITNIPTLTHLYCDNNPIVSLTMSNLPNFMFLFCSNTQLSNFQIDLPKLQELWLNQNQLTTLDLTNFPMLRTVYVHSSQNLVSIDFTGCTSLDFLEIYYNNALTNLTVAGLTQLKTLKVYNSTALTSLDVSGCSSLLTLTCGSNNLSALDVTGCSSLTSLTCSNNHITNLDLSDCSALLSVFCDSNQLASLDVQQCTQLNTLFAADNLIEHLNIKNGRAIANYSYIQNPLHYLCVDDVRIAPMITALASSGILNVEVNSYCSFVPGGINYQIQGKSVADTNSDGCDATDPGFPNLRYNITNGSDSGTLLPDASGNYAITLSAGLYTITPVLENPLYYTVSPPTLTLAFPAQASPVTQDFCISMNGSHPDLEVAVFPVGIARPGFDSKYKIIYKNKGTIVESGTVNLNFNNGITDFVSAIPTTSSQSVDNLQWNFNNLLPLQSREILVTLNLNSPVETPPVNANDILTYTASINGAGTDEVPSDNQLTMHQHVVNSLDPNDKTCIEGGTITPSEVGKYVHYVIRFENTGSANAENIVVKDMIDAAKFDIASLVPLDASHPFVTKISNANKVEFIFENINLPFDDANNDGYVSFKIKTKPSLIVGNTFSNSAGIYFDYNFPIITNTATTAVTALANRDFAFSEYLRLYPNPAKSMLHYEARNSISVSSASIYNILGQLVIAIPNSGNSAAIDISGLQTGTYFLRIISDKGSTNTKFIKE